MPAALPFLDTPKTEWSLDQWVDYRMAQRAEGPAPAPLTDEQIRAVQVCIGTIHPGQYN